MIARVSRLTSAVIVAALAGSASADDLGVVTMFGREYLVRRFDVREQVRVPDPGRPGREVPLTGVSGAHSLGEGRFLLCTPDMGRQGLTEPNLVVEVSLEVDRRGFPVGFRYVRTVVASSTALDGIDLAPRGVTVNPSELGLGATGDLVVASGSDQTLRVYDDESGAPIFWDWELFNGFSIGRPVTDVSDITYVPTRSMFFATWRQPTSAVCIFSREGRIGPAFLVAQSRYAGTSGRPIGMAFLGGWPNYPTVVLANQGAILVATDSAEPWLELYSVDGLAIGRQRVSSEVGPGIVPLSLPCPGQLRLEAIAGLDETGQLVLIHEGGPTGCTALFVLTPVIQPCRADVNNDGFIDWFDFDAFIGAFSVGGTLADFNRDGFVDFFDFDEFTHLFTNGCD